MKLIPPNRVAPVKAAPEDKLTENWPIMFNAGASAEDNEDWGLCTDRVHGSELLDLEFPGDSKSDTQFIAELINQYRNYDLIPSAPVIQILKKVREALEYAKLEMGKRTRPDPIDKIIPIITTLEQAANEIPDEPE